MSPRTSSSCCFIFIFLGFIQSFLEVRKASSAESVSKVGRVRMQPHKLQCCLTKSLSQIRFSFFYFIFFYLVPKANFLDFIVQILRRNGKKFWVS